jgi:hypothetical protein
MKKTICAAAAIAALAVPSAAVAKAPEGGWGQGGAPAGHGVTDPSGGVYGQAVSSFAPGGAIGFHASGGTASTGN